MKFKSINWYKRTKDGFELTVGSIPEEYPECVVYTEGKYWRIADIQTGTWWGRDHMAPTRKTLGPLVQRDYKLIHKMASNKTFDSIRDAVVERAIKDNNWELLKHFARLKGADDDDSGLSESGQSDAEQAD